MTCHGRRPHRKLGLSRRIAKMSHLEVKQELGDASDNRGLRGLQHHVRLRQNHQGRQCRSREVGVFLELLYPLPP